MISNNGNPFGFDINFSFGQESVFTDIVEEYRGTVPPPPVSGYFLYLDNTDFMLLDGTNLDLL